jgi:hypothetical protein
MTNAKDDPAAGKGGAAQGGRRQARLAEALRLNLQRRKAQQRGRADETANGDVESGPVPNPDPTARRGRAK